MEKDTLLPKSPLNNSTLISILLDVESIILQWRSTKPPNDKCETEASLNCLKYKMHLGNAQYR